MVRSRRRGRVARIWEQLAEHTPGGGAVGAPAVCRAAPACLGVDGVWVTVSRGGVLREPVCVSDARARVLEELQVTLGEGPCVAALTAAAPVLVPDLASWDSGTRWPAFAPAAVAAGAGAMFAFGLRVGAISAGVLSCYRQRPGPLGEQPLADAVVLADITVQLLLDPHTARSIRDLTLTDRATGQRWIGRAEVHQATGMISVQLGVSLEETFAQLRARAYAEGRPLTEPAADVVAHRLRFDTDDGS
jgi:hypothetical protein